MWLIYFYYYDVYTQRLESTRRCLFSETGGNVAMAIEGQEIVKYCNMSPPHINWQSHFTWYNCFSCGCSSWHGIILACWHFDEDNSISFATNFYHIHHRLADRKWAVYISQGSGWSFKLKTVLPFLSKCFIPLACVSVIDRFLFPVDTVVWIWFHTFWWHCLYFH